MGDNGAMGPALLDDLEDFVERGGLWSGEDLTALVERLEVETAQTGDPNAALLAAPLRAVLARLADGGVPPRAAHEVEAIVYPRMWKVMEAARDGLPEAEVRTRIEGLDRRLSRHLSGRAGR